jgi:DNA-binding GntR family transcriptional regulator
MNVFNPPQSNLLHTEVINAIINAIVTGSLKPGDRIIEQRIAEEMQISRAPVREAIRELVAQDIIKFLPRKGAYISSMDTKSIQEIYLLRSCLEGLAARLAATRLTEAELNELCLLNLKMGEATLKNNADEFIKLDLAFHELICRRSEHVQLIKMIDGVRIQTRLYMIMSKWHLVAHSQLNREMNAHQPILDAFRGRDCEEAEKSMREHIDKSGNLLLEYLTKS